ncbi:hypothetical protein JL193_15800 [Polaribacter batillariae]|uniref:Uncharacterized protein n=1 Tax=Polaribacter batillariae TaxID=2808900 RepID=A0ABX7STF4_9FLAO|nr:hypothetical protein [Polaribacter batillariae]QTD37520.1 hypothetical protein JL193_15800 [Polaribacter batillariae]
MKKILLLCVLVQSAFGFSQEEPEFQKYNAKNAASIFYYNFSEVPEKIKVKDPVIENKTITSLKSYNNKIKKISFLNSTKLQELELTINSLGKQLYSNRDLAEKITKKIQLVILPIRDSVAAYEETLNSDLKSFLSKRQFKKWLKYQRGEKRKLLPERPKSNRNTAPSINRRNRGLGGRRF